MRRVKSCLWVLLGLVFYAVLGAAFLGGLWLSPRLEARWVGLNTPLPPFGEAWIYLEQRFYGQLPPRDVRLRGAVRGLLETVDDPYTVLLEPAPAAEERRHLAGRYGDVGLRLWWTPEGQVALTPYPGGPAAQAGIAQGDVLLSIDGESIVGADSLDVIAQRLQGEVGTEVILTVRRPPTLTFEVAREEVQTPSVETRDLGGGIGYLALHAFTGRSEDEVRDALEGLASSEALVLDLRDNRGGVVGPVAAISGMFLQSDVMIYRDNDATGERTVNAKGERLFAGPLAVLVNGSTASAAEILAAALAENGRAVLIGQPTFGKGSIQSLYPLADGSTLHVTSAVWLTPGGSRIDGKGIQPDIVVEARMGADAPLDAAIDYLSKRIQ